MWKYQDNSTLLLITIELNVQTHTVMYTDNDGIDAFGFVQYYILAMDKIVLAVVEILNRLSLTRSTIS